MTTETEQQSVGVSVARGYSKLRQHNNNTSILLYLLQFAVYNNYAVSRLLAYGMSQCA